ncbi:ATP-dependent DNA helicase [Artomyces pyxidatus]|uniref:ATP-dependent DNA helicase n=1 Tax=Artomyces pyxidatus TaxID=48021 RepID=A0ACB8SWT7_9AGAM|nr:ATP-dependent DNA helicase [Artomyces pyxidatus]
MSSQVRNNLDDLQRLAVQNSRVPVAGSSSGTPVQKASKFKPAKAATPSGVTVRKTASATLPSFSTPGYGKAKPHATHSSTSRRLAQSSETIDLSSSDSAPPSPSTVSNKRTSNDPLSIPLPPKRQKIGNGPNKENLSQILSSGWKGKGRETQTISASPVPEAISWNDSPTILSGSSSTRPTPSVEPALRGPYHADLQSKSAEELQQLYMINYKKLEEERRNEVNDRFRVTKEFDPYTLSQTIHLLEDRLKAIDAATATLQAGRLPPQTSTLLSRITPPAEPAPPPESRSMAQIDDFDTRSAISITSTHVASTHINGAQVVDRPAIHHSNASTSRQEFRAADDVDHNNTEASDVPASLSEDELWEHMGDHVDDPMDDDVIEVIESPATASVTVSSSPVKGKQTALQDDVLLKASPHYAEALQKLKTVFKLGSFRPNQLGPIIATLEGRDVLVLLPTGGGKSLCFQLPAVCTGGKGKRVTIVISPLRALMRDQVDELQRKRVDVLAITPESPSNTHQLLLQDKTRPSIVYMTPEKLNAMHYALEQLYKKEAIARFVIDEAHTISSWGHDFRKEGYLVLQALRKDYPTVPIIAATATASPEVEKDIIHCLNLRDCQVFRGSFNRPNLRYTVLKKTGKLTSAISQYISTHHPGQAGIVYCLSRKSCEFVAEELRKEGHKARHFHADMTDEVKSTTLQSWLKPNGDCNIIVATIAFGMGIDKPDVRFVIHHDMPTSISGYAQETGRAGRDGERSECVLYYTFADCVRHQWMIEKDDTLDADQKKHKLAQVHEMKRFCVAETECRRVLLLNHFAERYNEEDCVNTLPCDNCSWSGEVVEEDVTAAAKDFLKFLKSVEAHRARITRVMCISAFRGSRTQAILEKGYHTYDGYGAGKDLERNQVERLVDHLDLRDLLDGEQEVQPKRVPITYVKLGSKAHEFLNGQQRFTLKTRVNAQRKGKAPVSQRSAAPRSKRKGARTELPDDPVEEDDPADLWQDEDWQDDVTADASYSGYVPRAADEFEPAPARPERAPVKKVQPTPVQEVVDLSQDEDPVLLCYQELLQTRTDICKADADHIDAQDVLTDEHLQFLSTMLPTDAANFKAALALGSADPAEANMKYCRYGRAFLDVCSKYSMMKKSPTASISKADDPLPRFHAAGLHNRFDYQGASSYSKPLSRAR